MDTETRIVLNMICRQESAIIKRCLDAVLPHVDGFVICDTGSTDNTPGHIRDAASAQSRMRGVVLQHVWQDFGHNRTLALNAARDWVKEQKWPLDKTYLLLIDADMVLHVKPEFDRSQLTGPLYHLAQVNGTLRYYNTRLVRLSHEWRCHGVTHEYYGGTPDVQPDRLESLWIDDRDDGGSKGDKVPRDVRLLLKGLEDDPANVRYLFYLAQSHFDLGQYEEAIRWYKKRDDAGGWEEECWYSQYRQGMAYLRMGRTELAAGALLAAYERRPSRAEPLCALARHYRERGMNRLASMLAKEAMAIPYPTDALFVEEAAYRSLPLEEIAITAFYVGKPQEGADACEKLLAQRGHHLSFYDYVARNASFYLRSLEPVRRGSFEISKSLRCLAEKFFGLEEPNTTEYLSSSPTIVEYKGEVIVNVRLVNYSHERGRVFASKDPDGVIRTRNVILTWDPDTDSVITEIESKTDLPSHWDHGTRVRGLEDQRWVVHGDRIWLTFTCFNIPGADGMPRVALGRVNEAEDGLDHVVALDYEGIGTYEKNWLIWPLWDDEMLMIYGYDPFVVLRVDPMTGKCEKVSSKTPKRHTARWRGSCAPARWRPGHWLGMVHETAWFENHSIYMHRLILLSDDMEIVGASRLFSLEHSGVEYCAGLLVRDEKVIVTYGHEESGSRWVEYERSYIEGLLEEGASWS